MFSIPARTLASNGSNVPVIAVSDPGSVPVVPEPGAQRYRHTYPRGRALDALLVNRGSNTLVVSLHGALNRSIFSIPRFERLRSLLKYRVSSLYFADPSLHIDPSLELSWYTGWEGTDAHRDIARWIMSTAEEIGAEHIVLTGSSGGGFAALMLASFIPDATTIVFNPQVDIQLYEADGKYPHAAKRAYIRHVWPELAAQLDIERFDFRSDWNEPIAQRTSALARFATPRDAQILYVNNRRDTHHDRVQLPALRDVMGSDRNRFRVMHYDGPAGHHPPDRDQFDDALRQASRWTGFALPEA